MKTFRKRLTAACSAAAVTLTMCGSIPIGSLLPETGMLTASAAVKTQCETYSGSNVGDQNYSSWANPIDSYLTALDGGGFMRFQNGALADKYLIEYYDEEYNIQKTTELDAELPLFGGFYETEDHYFLLTGQNDYEELKTVESYRITKYDKDWNRLDSVGMRDCNTYSPFEAGSARFAECGNYLLIRTCHKMYQSDDGLNHQANVTIQLDMESMEVTDSYTDVMNSSYGYVSHSFNQFIHVEDNRIIALDHGDAGPRSLVVLKYNTDVSTGKFVPSKSSTMCDPVNIVKFPGSDKYHYNFTGASVGGFEISETSYLAAYTAENYEDNNVDGGTQNIVVGVLNKKTDEVTNIQITDYAEGSASASTPHLVKTDDNSFVVLWSRENNVYYTALDGEGNPDEICTIENAALSDCVPVVADGKLVWYTWNNKVNTFYDIDLTDLSESSATVIENGHRMEITVTPTEPGGDCTMQCTECEEAVTFATPSSAGLYWAVNEDDSYSRSLSVDLYTGDSLYYWVYDSHFSALYHEYELTCSDPEAVIFTPSSRSMGTVTFLKEGTYTITATHKYNPTITTSTTYRVNHDKTHTLAITPAEEGSSIAFAVCQDCDYAEEVTVPTSFDLYWSTGGFLYSSTVNNPYCPDSQTNLMIQINDADVDNYDFTFEVMQPDLVTFTNQQKGYRIIETLSFLKHGETEVVIYPTYNPSVKKTVTLKAAHRYKNGICTACGTECPHDESSLIAATCLQPASCGDCGVSFGAADPENHESEEIYCEPNSSHTAHNVLRACCDAVIKEEAHQYTEESAGHCAMCDYECLHDSDNYTPASCVSVNICGDCGLEFGDVDPEHHAGEETVCLLNAEDTESHEVRYVCCDALKDMEKHSFSLDEETGEYLCICGAKAAWSVTSEGETTYFCDFGAVIETAETLIDSVITPLHDMRIDPFVLSSSSCTLDLNGMNITFTSASEQDHAIVIMETAVLCITDSKGGGVLNAPEGMDLLCADGGLLEIRDGTLRSDGTVIRNSGTIGISFYGGTLIGENGVVSEKGDVYFYGKPDLQCTGTDLLVGSEAMIHAETDLHGAEYSVSREEAGEFAALAEDLIPDDTWFVNQAENRVFIAEDGMLYVRYDLTKADILLDQEEYTYTGRNITPDHSGVFEKISLEESKHYEIRYTDADGNSAEPIAPGEYHAVLTGIGDFAGTVELPFHITKATPVIRWQKENEQTVFTGEAAVLLPPEIILTGADVFSGDILYSYRIAGSEDAFTEGLPVNAGSYEIMAAIEAFEHYTSAESDTALLLTIAKAPAPAYDPAEVSYAFTDSGEKTITMPELPKNAGAFGEPALVTNDPEALLDPTKSVSYSENTICLHTNPNPCTSYGKSAEIVIVVPSRNYEDITLRAVITMDKGTLTAKDLTFSVKDAVYDGKEKNAVLVPVDGVSGIGEMTLSYYDAAGKPIVPVSVGVYSVSAVIGEGEYYNAADLTDPDWTFTVTPAVPEVAAPTAKAVVYGQTLADSALTKGWTWADAAIIPTVKNDGFTAVFAVEDAENFDYSEVEGFDAKSKTITRIVPVTVIPAVPEVAAPTAKAVVYGQTLADSALTKGWTWADEAIIPTVKNDGFKAVFAVEDAENFDYSEVEGFDAQSKTITRIVPVTVIPAVPEVAAPTAKAVVYGQMLADSALTKGWTWADAAIIPTVKNDGFTAVFAVEDAENFDYSEVEGFDAQSKTITRIVAVTVSKADPLVTPLLVGITFTEGEKFPEITLSEQDTEGEIFWINSNGTLNGMENILDWRFIPEDAENYNEATGTMVIMAETTTTTATTTTETTTTTTKETTTTTATTTTETTTTTTKETTTTTATTTTETTTTTTKETTTTTATTTTETTTTTTKETTTTTAATTTETTTTTTKETSTTETTTITTPTTTTSTTPATTSTTPTTTTSTTPATTSTTPTTTTSTTPVTTSTTPTTTTSTTPVTTSTTPTTTTSTTPVTTSTTPTTTTSTTPVTTSTTPTTTTSTTPATTITTPTTTTSTTPATTSTTPTTTTSTTPATTSTTPTTTTSTTPATTSTTPTATTSTTPVTTSTTPTTTTSTTPVTTSTTPTTTTSTTPVTTSTTPTTTTSTTPATTSTTPTTTTSTTTETTTTATETSTTTETTTTATETSTTESTTTETTTTATETSTTESTTTETTTTATETSTTKSTTTETTTTATETSTTESTTTETTTTATETSTTESTTTETSTTATETSTTETTTTETTTTATETSTTESTTTETTTTATETSTTETTTTETTTTATETSTTETTTTETTTTATETSTTETTIIGYTYTVETKEPQFYFSHDASAFQPEELIESITRYAVYSDGSTSENGEILEDFDGVSFGGLTPEAIWTADGYQYSITAVITDIYGSQTIEKAVQTYIGVKGDANLDGTADAKDAAAILQYAAAAGAGQAACLYSADDEVLEAFAFWLAEVNTSGAADAKDAALILVYAAADGSGQDITWEELLEAA